MACEELITWGSSRTQQRRRPTQLPHHNLRGHGRKTGHLDPIGVMVTAAIDAASESTVDVHRYRVHVTWRYSCAVLQASLMLSDNHDPCLPCPTGPIKSSWCFTSYIPPSSSLKHTVPIPTPLSDSVDGDRQVITMDSIRLAPLPLPSFALAAWRKRRSWKQLRFAMN